VAIRAALAFGPLPFPFPFAEPVFDGDSEHGILPQNAAGPAGDAVGANSPAEILLVLEIGA
jgi:hypothetical protein